MIRLTLRPLEQVAGESIVFMSGLVNRYSRDLLSIQSSLAAIIKIVQYVLYTSMYSNILLEILL